MQIALGEQLLLDAHLHALAEQRAVGQHQRGAAVGLQDVLDQHQKEIGRLLGAHIGRKARLDARLLDAAEGRIGEHHIHALSRRVVAQRPGQRVVVADIARHLDAVEHQVGHAQQVRQLLLLHAQDAGLQQRLLLGVAHLLAQVLDGAHQKAARASGGVEHALTQLRVDHVHHELRDGARRVELARVAGALQVAQDLLVQIVELVTVSLAVEVDAGELVDHLPQQLPALHEVVGVLEHAAHHPAARVAHRVGREVLQLREELVVHEVEQRVAGDALGVSGPVPPAQVLGDGAAVVVAGEFELFLQRIEHLKEQQPHHLLDALRIAVDAGILAHDVLDGFDDGGKVGHAVSAIGGAGRAAHQFTPGA